MGKNPEANVLVHLDVTAGGQTVRCDVTPKFVRKQVGDQDSPLDQVVVAYIGKVEAGEIASPAKVSGPLTVQYDLTYPEDQPV